MGEENASESEASLRVAWNERPFSEEALEFWEVSENSTRCVKVWRKRANDSIAGAPACDEAGSHGLAALPGMRWRLPRRKRTAPSDPGVPLLNKMETSEVRRGPVELSAESGENEEISLPSHEKPTRWRRPHRRVAGRRLTFMFKWLGRNSTRPQARRRRQTGRSGIPS
jgi:hypothetical protein